MRLLICDDHVVFAESLAALLQSRGAEVSEVTHHPVDALASLERTPVDVCLTDVMFGSESVVGWLGKMRAVAPDTRFVLLCSHVDQALLAACHAAGVRGLADKRQPIAEILDLLFRVYGGERILPVVAPARGRATVPAVTSEAHRLAQFLTVREREVLGALVRGVDTGRLARSLGIAETTARSHIQAVLTKLGAHSRLEAATTAVRTGMVDPGTGEWLLPVN